MPGPCEFCGTSAPADTLRCPGCGRDIGGALPHLRALDLTGPGAQYCGRLMADLGADVVKVEPPAGDSARFLVPYAGDVHERERSIHFLVFNLNKRSVVVDLLTCEGRRHFRSLATSADIIVEDGTVADLEALGLGFEVLRERNPGLIYTTITPFGLLGPYSSYQGGELIVQALGGMMYGYGDPDVRPALAPLRQGYQLAAQHAAFASLAAVRYRNRSGRGQRIEVCIQEVLANILAYFGRYATGNLIPRRPGGTAGTPPTNTYPCSDGFIYMQPGYPRHVQALFDWMDNDVLKQESWQDREYRRQNSDVVTALVSEFTSRFPKLDFAAEAQRRHIPAAPLMSIEDLVHDEHLRARRFFLELGHPVAGRYEAPAAPLRMSESPCRVYRPAPLLGQHSEEVAEAWRPGPRAAAATGTRPVPPPWEPGSALPLRDLRILDFTRVWAGPFMTRYLAELGADVIKVESAALPDRAQADGAAPFTFAEIQRSKRSVTLNMARREAVSLLERLVTVCDVIAENFRPGVLEAWGLGYDRLRQLNPEVICLRMPGMGTSGPGADTLSYGQSLLAYTGLMELWAHPESPGITRPKVPFPDMIAAAAGAFALLSALEYRDRTGKGQLIELAQVEGLTATMGVAFADYSLNGRVWVAQGNRDPNAAPHDVFPCLGHDAWCAIACYTDQQWQALCAALESPPWASEARFATLAGRLANLEELNACISDWTRELTPRQVMRHLQAQGVPAGVVANAEDLYHDVNLRARDYVATVDHRPVFAVMEHPGATVRLAETPSRVVAPCPALGQHNREVFEGLLGIASDDLERLKADGVVQ